MARQITDSTYCECCVPAGCISGSNFEDKGYKEGVDRTQCNDYVTAYTDKAKVTGMYNCTGNGDDAATIEWSGGSEHFDGSLDGPCFGVTSFSFPAYITEGTVVKCTGESWAGPVGCSITCCYISAP